MSFSSRQIHPGNIHRPTIHNCHLGQQQSGLSSARNPTFIGGFLSSAPGRIQNNSHHDATSIHYSYEPIGKLGNFVATANGRFNN